MNYAVKVHGYLATPKIIVNYQNHLPFFRFKTYFHL